MAYNGTNNDIQIGLRLVSLKRTNNVLPSNKIRCNSFHRDVEVIKTKNDVSATHNLEWAEDVAFVLVYLQTK